mmetsp:Transcript_6675/g.27871  ORF Transcript_6675/g.27871 Transcript_6675/m.27871 type:complete len:637 (+) Transcript_6675:4858-6768(+)
MSAASTPTRSSASRAPRPWWRRSPRRPTRLTPSASPPGAWPRWHRWPATAMRPAAPETAAWSWWPSRPEPAGAAGRGNSGRRPAGLHEAVDGQRPHREGPAEQAEHGAGQRGKPGRLHHRRMQARGDPERELGAEDAQHQRQRQPAARQTHRVAHRSQPAWRKARRAQHQRRHQPHGPGQHRQRSRAKRRGDAVERERRHRHGHAHQRARFDDAVHRLPQAEQHEAGQQRKGPEGQGSGHVRSPSGGCVGPHCAHDARRRRVACDESTAPRVNRRPAVPGRRRRAAYGAMPRVQAPAEARRPSPSPPRSQSRAGSGQAKRLVNAQVHVHALHRCAAGTLAEVVQPREHQHLGVTGEHKNVDPVGVVAGLHVEEARLQRGRIAQRHHADEALAVIVGGQCGLDLFRRRARAELAQVQRHADGQALVEAAHHRHEHRRRGQAGMGHHLRQMLVFQAQAIGPRRLQMSGQRLLLVLGNHALATARIAGDRGGAHGRVARQQAGVHERAHAQDEGAGMATRVGDALGRTDGVALARRQLGQAEGPARHGAVGRAGVDQAGVGVGDHARRFARGGVGQAQEGHVRGVQQTRALGRVLALVRVDLQHLDVGAGREVLMDPQAGRALLSVDKHLERHCRCSAR